jgi:tetratricopeptide (TPR) repeat protein
MTALVTRWRHPSWIAVTLLTLSVLTASAQTRSTRELDRLVEAGDEALEEQRYGAALEAFSAAFKLAPTDASLALGAGFSAAMLGQLRDSRTWLERAVKLDPKFTEAHVVLGQVLYREGKVAEAVTSYEIALKLKPDDQGVARVLEQWRKESQLHSRFFETRGSRFSVIFEGPADDVTGRRIVDLLDQSYSRVGSILNIYPTDSVPVVLYTTQQFRDVTRSPSWAGAIFDGRIKMPVGGALNDTAALRRTLDHEYVHALVESVAGSAVPLWLNEGLATTLEPGGNEWTDALLRRTTIRLPFSRLERSFAGLSNDEVLVGYAQSARAVKKLMDLRGAPAVVALLQALGRGEPFANAFQQSTFMRHEEFFGSLSLD